MRPTRSFLAFVAATILLTACFTGERAYFATDEPNATDPAIAAVLTKLDTVTPDEFSADYSILLRFGSKTTAATVAQSSPTARSITIGTVRFLDHESAPQTCQLATSTCVAGLDDAQVSDAVPSHDFYRAAAAIRLRQDATTKLGAAVASTRDVAGQSATCVQVVFTEGLKTYCALDNGLLAYQDTPDVLIELVGLGATVDPAVFSPSTVAPG